MGDLAMNSLSENAVVYYTQEDSSAPVASDGQPLSPPFKKHTEVQRSMNFGEPYAVHECEQIYGIQNPDHTVQGAAHAYFESLTDALDKRLVYFIRKYDHATQQYAAEHEFQTLASSGENWEELPDKCDVNYFPVF